jgi:hypothetical protein
MRSKFFSLAVLALSLGLLGYARRNSGDLEDRMSSTTTGDTIPSTSTTLTTKTTETTKTTVSTVSTRTTKTERSTDSTTSTVSTGGTRNAEKKRDTKQEVQK